MLHEAQTRDLICILKKIPIFPRFERCMDLFSWWAFPCTCPHPTRWAIHSFNWIPLHNPPVFVLVQSLSLCSLSEWCTLKNSLAQWLLSSKTSSQSFPAGTCCPKGKAIKRSLADLAFPFTWAGLASLLCSAGFPGCWNLLPALLPGWAGSLVHGNKLDSCPSTCSCQRSVLRPGSLEMAFCPCSCAETS